VTKPAYEEARQTFLILHFSIKIIKFREVKLCVLYCQKATDN
jgi:hypothetical protein